MKKYKYSLYLALAIIIFIAVAITTTINSFISYNNLKEKTILNMKVSSTETILSLKDNVQNLIAAYAVNEYEKLITNEINRKNIYAIVIEDYNMGKIIGQNTFVTGKMKSADKIIDYKEDDYQHNTNLRNAFYKDKYDLTSKDGKPLGKISIFITDERMQSELNEIIITNLKITILLSIFLVIFLFITIRRIILQPISNIIDTITKRDSDGIPLGSIPNHSLREIDNLAKNINEMISSIKKSRKVLRKEQNRLKYLLELSPIAVRIAKSHGEDVIFANNAYSKLLRLNKDETIHKNPKDYYQDQAVYENIVTSLDNNEQVYNELVELKIDDEIVWALASYMNINFDGEKSIIGWFYDVTNEKVNESKLFEALELQTRVFDNAGYLIVRTDKEGVIKQVNKEIEHLLGYKSDELVNMYTPEKFHLQKEIEDKKRIFERRFDIKLKSFFDVFTVKSKFDLPNEDEWTYVAKDGKQISVSLNVSALKNKENEIFGYIGIAKDITQNKILESQAKLASMGEMIGNIAHQWRQPLSAISSIASGMKVKNEFDIAEKDEISKDMDSIVQQVNYLSRTIDDFREFIKDKDKKEQFELSTTIEKTLSILKPTLTNNEIDLILNIKDDMKILGYENQLIQSFINIINNSKDAIKESLGKNDKKLIFIDTALINGEFVINIKDNAGGIDMDIIDKIFEPYFTTKHQSVGTGIGLSMSYQIITEYHNATIQASNVNYDFEDKNYTGANFEIAFQLEEV